MQSDPRIILATGRHAKCVENSRRIRWDIDEDVFRVRVADFWGYFLRDGLSMIDRVPFLGAADRRRLSRIQGRTYARAFRRAVVRQARIRTEDEIASTRAADDLFPKVDALMAAIGARVPIVRKEFSNAQV